MSTDFTSDNANPEIAKIILEATSPADLKEKLELYYRAGDKRLAGELAKGRWSKPVNEACVESSPTLDDIARDARTSEALRQQMRQQLIRESKIAAGDDRLDYGADVVQQPLPPAKAQSELGEPEGAKFFRVVYPHKNERYEVYATSQKELDERVARVNARYKR
jgi:hypothetical protein